MPRQQLDEDIINWIRFHSDVVGKRVAASSTSANSSSSSSSSASLSGSQTSNDPFACLRETGTCAGPETIENEFSLYQSMPVTQYDVRGKPGGFLGIKPAQNAKVGSLSEIHFLDSCIRCTS